VQGKKIQFRTKKKANKQKLERKRLTCFYTVYRGTGYLWISI